jgi:pyruvate,water dikinase
VFEKLLKFFRRPQQADLGQFKELFERFQQILKGNNRVLEIMSELEDKLGGEYIFDINYLKNAIDELSESVYYVVSNLNVIADNHYRDLHSRQISIQEDLKNILEGRPVWSGNRYLVDYDDVDADMADLVGGKNANLGEMRNHLDILTPDGFVITSAAYHRFMEHNDLWPEIHRIHGAFPEQDKGAAESYDLAISRLFDSARVPADIGRGIGRHLSSLHKRLKYTGRVAVRSSASGEDSSRQSFAGQFMSVLNLDDESVPPAYMQVVGSRFKHGVAVYAGERAFHENELPMAVGVQQMIAAQTAGVAYSVEPSGEFPDCLAISASFGLGTVVVGGTMDTDYYRVSRLDLNNIVSRRIGRKMTKVVPSEPLGVASVDVPEDQREVPCLTDEQVVRLAETVLILDRYFKRPVDLEWCYDEHGDLYILQCRPLQLKLLHKPLQNRVQALANVPVLMRRQGQVAQRGIAVGKVRLIDEDDNASDFPVGAIAVTKYTTPRLAAIIRRAAAIITDVGSSTGHMATVAREFGVPMIANTGNATSILNEGSEVTVDAEENVIYEGVVKELLAYEAEAEDVYRDLREYHILRQLLRRISPLHLVDPNSSAFTARNCRSYHDIVRFSHEKAVKILINLNMSSRRFRGIESRELKLQIPLGLHVIDLGGGLAPDIGGRAIKSVDLIRSVPMQAILKGLTAPGTWSTQPMQLGIGDIMTSLTRYSMTDRGAAYQGQNLAVISDKYTNISLRLGYHFNVIDTYLSENVDDNYIYFRFVGGVTENERRHLRAILIKDILEKFNFRVTVSGDLVVARLKKLEFEEARHVLEEIGRLIGFTRQLDTQMRSEQSISECFRAFFEGPKQQEQNRSGD